MYKHILYATDFSKASLEIEKKVANLSEQLQSQISVIHVVNFQSTVWAGAGGYFVLAELDEENLKDSQQALAACEDRMPKGLANSHTVQGSPKQEIVRYAQKIGADLIVLGSHGHYKVTDILGTTATGVLNKANCDVLVIRPETEE